MSVNSETKKLIASIHDQVNIGHIDWERVAKDLGTPTANAARVRWQRFRKTLPNLNNEQNEDGTITPPPMTPRKLQSPKKSKTLKGSPTKKQKRSRPGKDSDDDDDELRFDMKEKEEKKDILPETPARCLPSRKAKAKSPIKKTVISDEEDEEIKIEIKDEEQIENKDTQETQGTSGSTWAVLDSGSDFDGDMEE